ncbi:MAG: hypothetical protein HY815_31715 [Candidatus Riflebacteria bacterium]|nr:hypothetical protein [Candidatus Riflebacteria bacterium]
MRTLATALSTLLVMACCGFDLMAAESAPPKIYVPQWKKGDTWTVECDMPDALVAKRPPWLDNRKPNSSRHPRWVFTVDKLADMGRFRLISVQVRRDDPKARSSADLVFSGRLDAAGLLASLFLYKAVYRYPAGVEVNSIRKDYNRQSNGPFPVINDETDAPTDFPCLNVVDSPADASGDGIWKEYQATDLVDKDLRSRSVRQTTIFATAKMQFGEQIKVPVDRSLNQDVYMKLLHASGNYTVRLVFNPAYPWPVYGEGPKGRYWLVK